MGENEISICPLLLKSLLILFYHSLHTSHSVSSQGYTGIDNIFTWWSFGDSLTSVTHFKAKLWFNDHFLSYWNKYTYIILLKSVCRYLNIKDGVKRQAFHGVLFHRERLKLVNFSSHQCNSEEAWRWLPRLTLTISPVETRLAIIYNVGSRVKKSPSLYKVKCFSGLSCRVTAKTQKMRAAFKLFNSLCTINYF